MATVGKGQDRSKVKNSQTLWKKNPECGTWQDLQRMLNEKLDLLAKHHYNWIHQVEQCRQVDFSENLQAPHRKVVNRPQFTPVWSAYQTGVNHMPISHSLRHDERDVWAHIEPILKKLKE